MRVRQAAAAERRNRKALSIFSPQAPTAIQGSEFPPQKPQGLTSDRPSLRRSSLEPVPKEFVPEARATIMSAIPPPPPPPLPPPHSHYFPATYTIENTEFQSKKRDLEDGTAVGDFGGDSGAWGMLAPHSRRTRRRAFGSGGRLIAGVKIRIMSG